MSNISGHCVTPAKKPKTSHPSPPHSPSTSTPNNSINNNKSTIAYTNASSSSSSARRPTLPKSNSNSISISNSKSAATATASSSAPPAANLLSDVLSSPAASQSKPTGSSSISISISTSTQLVPEAQQGLLTTATPETVAAAVPAMAQAPKQTRQRTYADAALAAAINSSEDVPASLLRKRKRLPTVADSNMYYSKRTLLRKVFSRELGCEQALGTRRSNARERFSNVSLQHTFDTHDPVALAHKMSWLQRRSKIIEIVSARDLIFSLTHTGVCAAFSRDLGRRLCFLNIKRDEVIRSLFLNKTNDALITVSVFKTDDFSSLHCRSTPLAHIRRGYLESGHPIFESESLRWPGFVEFDDVNERVLTFSAEDKTYKVWSLKTYQHLYTIKDDHISEIKISPGIMLLIYHRQESSVQLKIINVEDGSVIKEMRHLLLRKRKIDFIEQFNEKLLVKQEGENLQIVDVRTSKIVVVEKSHFLTPNAFIFLYENRVFLTFRRRQISVWNFDGQRQTNFEDHVLWHADSNTSSIYITQNQDLIMSYCQQDAGCLHGSINISWISDGKSLCKISCGPGRADDHLRALEDVTALYYNEERNEIYTGNRQGMLHVWSS